MEQKREIEILDVVKFIMAIMVVGIHTLGRYGIYPLFRIAVPLFFMISSYLFFSNTEKRGNLKYLKKFCIRNIKLYCFWFVVLMPVFLPMGGYLTGNLLFNAFKLIIKVFFGSTFAASWYISALVIGMCFIFICDKLNNNHKVILAFTFGIYVVCCLNSNYRNLMNDSSIIVMINRIYPGTIYNGFLVGLLWIYLGYMFACQGSMIDKKRSKIGLIVSSVLLLVEYVIVTKYHLSVDNDCYFMLVPVCYFAFDNLISCEWKCKRIDVKVLRKYSTIIYCVHGSLAGLVEHYWISGDNFIECILKFILVLFMSLIVTNIVCVLEKKKTFKWLRNAY
ncbi:acyltransferase [Dorea formicigenerans]|uniref:acyltransferase family protein n=1 Tax=Dorea formicigenerans TaxID=39486 RepID=UPI001570ACD2|nr:acyltransferase [Dorea formicigenerans]NSE47213.1 acyltransferase [Dorea formicigenerans]